MLRLLYLFGLLTLFCGAVPAAGKMPSDLKNARQLVVITTSDAANIKGELRKFERGSGGFWREVGTPHAVTVGRTGLAFSEEMKGFLPFKPNDFKREGDGKSPAGVFRLNGIFGASDKPANVKMPYLKLLSTTECVDDGSSVFYNQTVDNKSVNVDWKSSEKMLSVGEQYDFGVFVAHNTPPQSGKGSCIFLHIWKDENTPTAGCSAMRRENLLPLLEWLDDTQNPVLVQLTKGHYRYLEKLWRLPEIEFETSSGK